VPALLRRGSNPGSKLGQTKCFAQFSERSLTPLRTCAPGLLGVREVASGAKRVFAAARARSGAGFCCLNEGPADFRVFHWVNDLAIDMKCITGATTCWA